MAKADDDDSKNVAKVASEPNMTYVQENAELRALIDTVSRSRPPEGDHSRMLLGQYETAFPEFKRPPQRLPSTLRRTPGDRSLDLDDVNEVKIGIEKRLEEETIDNEHAFTRKIDDEQRKRIAESQCKKSSFQDSTNVPGTGAALPRLQLGSLRRVKMTKKRTIQGKTTINRTTTRKEEERSMTSPTGETDCRRNVDESSTTAENAETHEEELVETYDDDDAPP
ncbi:uncharacterized protein LOC119387205 [Rhipicephalus sanguineus]|uniref:Uncharacterized protein n=1 Tax=Rhipicephalus sanguineus TaxID=34632 RepID=A0A9D4YNM2_RHISA|nr:uncharacterized protein LOC119387205 [Rhipicephalus sanguineus]KAH7983426.1 hypothetical protein HPB52_011938 [Rhipicephalus sanguineus]